MTDKTMMSGSLRSVLICRGLVRPTSRLNQLVGRGNSVLSVRCMRRSAEQAPTRLIIDRHETHAHVARARRVRVQYRHIREYPMRAASAHGQHGRLRSAAVSDGNDVHLHQSVRHGKIDCSSKLHSLSVHCQTRSLETFVYRSEPSG